MIEEDGLNDEVWSLALRSLQTAYIEAWKESLRMTAVFLSRAGDLSQTKAEPRSDGGVTAALVVKKDQTDRL